LSVSDDLRCSAFSSRIECVQSSGHFLSPSLFPFACLTFLLSLSSLAELDQDFIKLDSELIVAFSPLSRTPHVLYTERILMAGGNLHNILYFKLIEPFSNHVQHIQPSPINREEIKR
jgi:hypothetical protein